mmetsp:Transcript_207/g.182  ORF Transcript_207/g.182 Transcript_207/m.182 type:complete len:134 (+) Transcript_207:427-828(+)
MKKKLGAKLNPLGSGGGDSAKVQEMQKEIDALKAKNGQLQQDLIKLNKEKSSGSGAQNSGGFSIKSENEFIEENNMLSEKLTSTQKQLEELKDDMNKKLNESVQFNNMKKMMQQKNDQIKTLRTKLSKYETVD